MDKIRFLPWAVAVLVVAGLIAARFIPINTNRPQPRATVIAPAPATPQADGQESPAMTQQAQQPIPAEKVILPPALIVTAAPPAPPAPNATRVVPITGDPKKAAPAETKWVEVYKDTFETPESVKKYALLSLSDPPSELQWHEKHKAMMLRNNSNYGGEVFAAVRKSLPGDLRVRFKAMCRKSETEVSIGIMFSVAGELRKEDGYFAEWAGGSTKLKKANVQQTGASAPTPQTADRWVNLELRRVGPRISMYMEGKEVTNWTDEQPVTGSLHDLMSFYVWSETTLIKDLVIERNANDPTKALKDDPAADDNMLRGARNASNATPVEGNDF